MEMEDDNDFEGDRINFSTLSLKHIVTVKIATLLWTQPDIMQEIKDHFENMSDLTAIGNLIILEKVPHLSLPTHLEGEVSSTVKPVGLQLFLFNKSVKSPEFPHPISWMMDGGIDETKSFLHTRNRNQEIKTFLLISKYCLKDIFIDLWIQMPNDEKNSLYRKCLNSGYQGHLMLYWICYAENELPKLLRLIKPNDRRDIYNCNHSVPKNMFILSTLVGSVYAAKYFWRQLTPQERYDIRTNGVSIIDHVPLIGRAEMLCFLLSKMDGKEQREVLKSYADRILFSFIYDRPWQIYLLRTICFIWDILSENVYVDLLVCVAREIGVDRGRENLLLKLFHCAPRNLKSSYVRFLIENPYKFKEPTEVFRKLIDADCFECVQEILRHANTEERRQLLFSFVEHHQLCEKSENKISTLHALAEEFLTLECRQDFLSAIVIE